MLNFSFKLMNPRRTEDFKSLFEKTWHVLGNKYFEVQATRYRYYLFELDLDLRWKGSDHAGPSLQLGLFGYNFTIKIYDSRHWDYYGNDWEKLKDKHE